MSEPTRGEAWVTIQRDGTRTVEFRPPGAQSVIVSRELIEGMASLATGAEQVRRHRDVLSAMIERLGTYLDGAGLNSWKHGACWAAEHAIGDLSAEVERLRARPYWNGTDAMSPGWEAALAEVERLREALDICNGAYREDVERLQNDCEQWRVDYESLARRRNEARATIQRVRDLPRVYGDTESLERFVRVSDLDAALDGDG
jgi:hypothetical protein